VDPLEITYIVDIYNILQAFLHKLYRAYKKRQMRVLRKPVLWHRPGREQQSLSLFPYLTETLIHKHCHP
jgi:hypothetical protein